MEIIENLKNKIFQKDAEIVVEKENITIILTVPKGVHIEPKYYGYEGGFDRVNVCNVCFRTALSNDMNAYQPCPNCGGKVIDNAITGKWDINRKKWLKREEYFEKDIKEFLNNKDIKSN